jgi:hypothetical protein
MTNGYNLQLAMMEKRAKKYNPSTFNEIRDDYNRKIE